MNPIVVATVKTWSDAIYDAESNRPSCAFFNTSMLNFFYLQHRRHDAFRFFVVLALQHLAQDSENDLPRHTESVFEPPALYFLAACGELLPAADRPGWWRWIRRNGRFAASGGIVILLGISSAPR